MLDSANKQKENLAARSRKNRKTTQKPTEKGWQKTHSFSAHLHKRTFLHHHHGDHPV